MYVFARPLMRINMRNRIKKLCRKTIKSCIKTRFKPGMAHYLRPQDYIKKFKFYRSNYSNERSFVTFTTTKPELKYHITDKELYVTIEDIDVLTYKGRFNFEYIDGPWFNEIIYILTTICGISKDIEQWNTKLVLFKLQSSAE